ncbi:MAG TPA: glycosyltransferase [Feifaniaceae bacterium]|nr:glycosyltransferase [Feifaniaceae bacterium]
MKVLVLSCSTGQGHNTAAAAVMEALSARGAECTLLDPFSLKREQLAKRVADAYIRNAVYAPALFGAFYKLGGLISSSNGRSPVYWANTRYARELADYIMRGGYDAVVTSHLYPAEALTYLKRKKRLRIPFYTVMTDYTCSPFWEETRPDVCFTPGEEITALCQRRGMAKERLFEAGIPVRKQTRERLEKAAARERLGIPNDAPLIVVMGGSMGGGKMEALVEALLTRADGKTQVSALCGSNQPLAKRLTKRHGGEARLRVVGYTDQAALWMQACDVLLTKPGGLSSTEAAVTGVPLILTAPIPGCETCNAAYFVRHGMAERAFRPSAAAQRAISLLSDSEACQTMLRCQRNSVHANAAERIAERIIGDRGGRET